MEQNYNNPEFLNENKINENENENENFKKEKNF